MHNISYKILQPRPVCCVLYFYYESSKQETVCVTEQATKHTMRGP